MKFLPEEVLCLGEANQYAIVFLEPFNTVLIFVFCFNFLPSELDWERGSRIKQQLSFVSYLSKHSYEPKNKKALLFSVQR